MASNDYDDLLETFMTNSSKIYNSSSSANQENSNAQEEKGDNMSKYRTSGGRNKIAIFFEVIAAIAAIVTIIGFTINYTIDFALTTKTEGNCTEYVFSKSGMDIKNASATLYYIVEFPINDSDDSIDYLYNSLTTSYDSSNCTFRYEIPVDYNEKVLCEAFGYMYYDTTNPYNIPKLSTYIKVEYEIALLPNVPLRKWYRVSYEKDTRYLYPHNRKYVNKVIDYYDENQYTNLMDFYNKNKADLGYISSSDEEIMVIPINKNIDDMIAWINETRVRPLSKTEKEGLVALYKYNANLEDYEGDEK